MTAVHRSTLRLHATAAAATLALLGACASLPLEPDRSARAPRLEGYGQVDLPLTTRSPEARQWFAQGMAQAYAFNEVEAQRAFKAALAQDPGCALCAWGVAWQLGPNINAPVRDDKQVAEALRYIDLALRHAPGSTPRERELIEAMALRYAHASEARNTAPLLAGVCRSAASGTRTADPLDEAYAERLRELVDRHPEDPDLLTLYAEAELIATSTDWWDRKTGQPGGRVGEVADRLEAGLKLHPMHTGLNHFLIHTVDAQPVAHHAEAAADRLGALAPRSPHLLHMPSHTYAQIGRYADATAANTRAMAADAEFAAQLGREGFELSKDWRAHNSAFQWFGALMEGRGDLALEIVRARAERAAAFDSEQGDYVRSLPILTLMRLESWEAVLAEPMPRTGKAEAAGRSFAVLFGEQARGTALARTGQADAALAALARLETAATALLKAHAGTDDDDKLMRGMVEAARSRLGAELALAQGRADDALALQAAAVTALDEADHMEPPMLGAGGRLALGDLQLQARRWSEAEQSYRADLLEHPHSGWALRGLARALQGQGRQAEAAAQRAELAQHWRVADAALRSGG